MPQIKRPPMYCDLDITKFLNDWYEPFQKVHQGINMIAGFPEEQLRDYHPKKIMTFEERIELQKYWLRILSLLEEKDQIFFKQHWVPVQEDLCQWFIDLSDPKFPVFASQYAEIHPTIWHRNVVSESLSDLILDLENGKSCENLNTIKRITEMKTILSGIKKHKELIFKGDLPISPVELGEVFVDGQVMQPIAPEDEDAFIILNAQPLAIGLLDPDTDISLNTVRFDGELDLSEEEFERISKIRHLMLLLREEGQEHFLEIQFDLIDSDVMVWHNSRNELILMGMDGPGKKQMIAAIHQLSKTGAQNN